MAILIIQEKIDGVMEDISNDSIKGKTIRELYERFQGEKVVFEWQGVGFVCGTEIARDHYRRKGHKAITFTEGLITHSGWLWFDHVPVPEVFFIPGCPTYFEFGDHITMDKP